MLMRLYKKLMKICEERVGRIENTVYKKGTNFALKRKAIHFLK